MFIDIQIPLRLHREIEKTVLGEKLQHMVKKSNAGTDLALPAPIQGPLDADIGFFGRSMNTRLSWC